MLTKAEREFVNQVKNKTTNLTALEKQKLYRIRNKSRRMLDDLTYLAQELPEKQLGQVFTGETILPFATAVLHRSDTDRKRICKIVTPLIGSVLGDQNFASRFIPEGGKWLLPKNEENPMKVVEALFFASMMCSE